MILWAQALKKIIGSRSRKMIYRLDCTEKSNKCKCSMRKSRAVRPALFCKGNIYRAAGSEPQANKSFSVQQFYKNAAEVWASSPHLRSKFDFAICFSCCNCIFWSCQIQTKLDYENQGCKFRQGNGAIAACWQAKAGVEPPFAGCERSFSLRAGFSVRHPHCNCFTGTVARLLFTASEKQGEAVLSMSLT